MFKTLKYSNIGKKGKKVNSVRSRVASDHGAVLISVSLALSPQVDELHYVWDARPVRRQTCGLPRNLQQRSPTCLLIATHLSDPFGWTPESSLPAPRLEPRPSRIRGVLPNPLSHTARRGYKNVLKQLGSIHFNFIRKQDS